MKYNADTIAAVATGRGGAIAVIRVSGGEAIAVCDRVFRARGGRRLSEAAGHTVHFGEIRDGAEVVDEVLATVFRAPKSYTGEDSVELSCHASAYIERRVMGLLIAAGARAAEPGEFTVRAFLAGRIDLAQAEAVADLIASSNRASHRLAIDQMRGGVSSALAGLRAELVELAALLELELDFGEEDVEFASRGRLAGLAGRIAGELDALAATFALGNAIREGVPVAIVGRPNAGKSTLLNALAGDDRAMVSHIAGTTRDRIEERVTIGGIGFRLIDTAGLRATDDVLERMGIDRALGAVSRARIVLLVTDGSAPVDEDPATQIAGLSLRCDQKLLLIINKIDKGLGAPLLEKEGCRPKADGVVNSTPAPDGDVDRIAISAASPFPLPAGTESVAISAKTGEGLDALREWLCGAVDTGAIESGSTVISGARHYEALLRARESIGRVLAGLGGSCGTDEPDDSEGADVIGLVSEGPGASCDTDSPDFSEGPGSALPTDLLAEELREVLHHLGTITGEVTTDELLGTIFSKFCIGK